MDLSTNPNTYWMSIFVDELARCGLESVCISPGSRSTPLTLAFANHGRVRIYRHLDERSGGFFALGLAMASKRPVALVCTSGTAAANYHPAIIEAYYSNVPLLVLTADRPPELRGSGANQTIDQIKMYGDHVRWSVEVPLPETTPPDSVLLHLRTLAARAYATAAGQLKGPVHLNFPFRKPLEPGAINGEHVSMAKSAATDNARPYTLFTRGRIQPEPELFESIAMTISANPRGFIICGPNAPGGDFPAAVTALAEQSGYPILADSLSGLRHGTQTTSGMVMGSYPLWLPHAADWMRSTTTVIRFGSLPTSSALSAFLEKIAPANHFHVRDDGEWADDLHLTHDYIQADPASLCRGLTNHLEMSGYVPSNQWASGVKMIEEHTQAAMRAELETTPFFDGSAINTILSALPADSVVFAGNSMPVRHVDIFDRPGNVSREFYGNRGASGIDGNVSTALGIAVQTGKHVVAILGDITFYHDMNGLQAIRQNDLANITIFVINNDGGSIFHRLPIAQYDPPFTDLFLTPHGLSFSHAAALYGLRYAAVEDRSDMASQLEEVFYGSQKEPTLIEIKTDSYTDFHQMRALTASVVSRLKSAGLPEIERELPTQ